MASSGRQRGFGVAAGLDPEVAAPLAARCAELGYDSLWSNDHPGALGLETLAVFADAAPELELGVGVMALDRHSPAEIESHIDRLGLDPERLWLGVGAGFSGAVTAARLLQQKQSSSLRVVLANGSGRVARGDGQAP